MNALFPKSNTPIIVYNTHESIVTVKMLDINLIRKEPKKVEELLSRKGCKVNFDEFLASDREEKLL